MSTNLDKLKATGINPSTMPKKLKAIWLKALRSGKYKRAKGTLYDQTTCGFCCLGVLEHAVTGGVEYIESDNSPRMYPTVNWLSENDINFNQSCGFNSGYGDCKVFYSGRVIRLSELNDSGKLSFKKIADIIDKQVIGV